MSSEVSEFAEEISSTMLKELQSWWEIPSIAQYISLFREPFNLPEIEIEELEKGFIDDTLNGPSEWLQNLVCAFLKSITSRSMNQENWYEVLKRHIRRKWPEFPYCEKENPFPLEQDTLFHQLSLRSKVEILYCCCLSRLDKNDIMDQMKSMDAEALRVQKLGMDDAGNTYWYFYGTRLYKEEFPDEKKSWDEEWKEQKRKSFQKKKRGRGRPRKQATYDEESDSETSHNDSGNGFMNVNEKSRWSVVCDTIEEWVNFAEKFKNSKSKSEKSLFTIIQENFLPTLNNIYEEKEKKLQQKIKELMPTREKIVTRRETRRLRGEDLVYSPANGYGSDEGYRTHVVKDRARRLEERNKRASEAENIQVIGHKRARHDRSGSGDSSFQISENNSTDLQTQMERILTNVKLHKDAWPFLYPVSEEDAPGYYEIIKDPVDLSKIEHKLYSGEYESIGDLDADFKKMESNCELYNGEYHPYSKMAQALRKMFRKEIAKLLDSLQAAENACADSEGSSDSQYHSSSNTSSPPHESHQSSKEHKPKSGHKKKRKASEALDLLAKASDEALQENHVARTSPQQKSPNPPETQSSSCVPSTNMPYNPASSTGSTITKPPLPVASVNFAPGNNSSPEGAKKTKPVIIFTKAVENVARTSPPQNLVTSSFSNIPGTNTITTVQKSTVPLVISGYNSSPLPNQMKKNPVTTVTTMSNMCVPNGMPIMQQVLIPAGSQQILQNNGQFVLTASPQNTVKVINKEQNMQIQSAIRPMNQTFAKVVPQIVNSAPLQLQISKDGIQNFQFQTLSPSNNQTFTQVAQSPQFLNIPYMLTNQNALSNSPQQSVINLQPYQLPPRQMQISGPGNG